MITKEDKVQKYLDIYGYVWYTLNMKINVQEQPSTYKLEDGIFYCEHESKEEVEYIQDSLYGDEYRQSIVYGYVCTECGEPIDD